MRRAAAAALLAALPLAAAAAAARAVPLAAWARPGRVLLLRHAIAPGVGDPPGFRLADCATQRNLDAAGRTQSRAAGAALRAALAAGAATPAAAVYTSQWCRAKDTAALLGLGPPRALPALNSFFQNPSKGPAQMAELRKFLAALPPRGPPVVLVTHQVVVSEFSPVFPAPAGGALLELNGSGAPRLLGSVGALA
ncbi:MAG: phosphoglycerate mutase [Monoraphidium minutum]|nr:MAG: phosphoglycerate mutase [Monoraphidium minutum]